MIQTLKEFLTKRDEEQIDVTVFDALISALPVKQLNTLFAPCYPLRRHAATAWTRALAEETDQPIRLSINEKGTRPYMSEQGTLFIPKSTFHHLDLLFIAIAHESAHFILMTSPDYERLQELDAQYRNQGHSDVAMRSPTEYYANLLTLRILTLCQDAASSTKLKERIGVTIDDLSRQMRKQ